MKSIAQSEVQAPKDCPLKFEFSEEAAVHNTALLAEVDYDLGRFIESHPGTTISPGSELRPLSQLQPLLRHHPMFDRFASNLTNGIDYPLNEIDDASRLANVEATIQRGNHKSAMSSENQPHVTKSMEGDVKLGYAIPIKVESIKHFPEAEVYPIGVQDQMTINELGEIIPKKRVTHDLSHNRASGESINQRVIEEELPEIIYGHSLLRFIHLIHFIRWLHPNERILCNKFDIEKAYRRLHVIARIALKCIAIWKSIASILLRLPFGSSPAPSEFCVTSEIVFDLGNDLLQCEQWDPATLPTPYNEALPEPVRLDDNIPFGKAEEADVKLDSNCKGGCEGYIDDGPTAVLDSPENWRMVRRAREAICMALHLVFRPLAGSLEPIERPDAASIRKMLAEGGLAEIMIYLGWEINTRALTIAIPFDKWKAWSADIQELLKIRTVKLKSLSSLIGKLNHVCFIIPNARHFMNNLHRMETIAKSNDAQRVKLSQTTLADLDLWLEFLTSARDGISMNRIVFRKPTQITFSDSSEIGISGFSPHTGIAWRHPFTEEEAKSFTLNVKEYIASAIDMDLQAQFDTSGNPYPCILNRTDSTSTAGWLRKSNHDASERPIHNEIARWHARNIMKRKACNYSQHLEGKLNVVTDCFSRDFHLSDDQLVSMLTSLHPSLSPSQIKVINLPEMYTSWIASLAQRWPGTRELPKQLIKSEIAAGISGWDSCNESALGMTPIWKPSMDLDRYASAVHSCMQKDEVILGECLSKATLRERPLTMWQRPSSRVIGQAPSLTQEERPISA